MSTVMTQPRYVVRKGSLSENVYLQSDGSWGDYRTAKRFSEAAADAACGPNDGIFPCSMPRRRGARHATA